MATQTPYPYLAQRQLIQEKNAKIGIRLATIPLTFGAIILQSIFAANDYRFREIDEPLPFTFSLSIAFLVLSIIWCTAELVVLRIRKHSIHPGAHVAIDLIVALGVISSAVLQEITISYGYNSAYTNSISRTGAAFCFVVGIFHTTLFIWACIDTHRLRRELRRRMLEATMFDGAMSAQQNTQGPPPYEVPAGMVLISIETLTQLKQKGEDPVDVKA